MSVIILFVICSIFLRYIKRKFKSTKNIRKTCINQEKSPINDKSSTSAIKKKREVRIGIASQDDEVFYSFKFHSMNPQIFLTVTVQELYLDLNRLTPLNPPFPTIGYCLTQSLSIENCLSGIVLPCFGLCLVMRDAERRDSCSSVSFQRLRTKILLSLAFTCKPANLQSF